MADVEKLMTLFENTISELKRAEHSIYVSLKYTRTPDILESILDRLINTLSNLIELLITLKTEEPYNEAKKTEKLLSLYHEDFAKDIVKYYQLLRTIKKRNKQVVNQFRRHLKLIVEIAPMVYYIIDIDSVVENYKLIKSFVEIGHKYFLEVYSNSEEMQNY